MPNLTVNTTDAAIDITTVNLQLTVPAPPSMTIQMDVGQGPSGVIGSDYTVRFEQVSPTVLYRAEAVSGSAEGSNVWRLQKITFSGSSVTVTWADGVSSFTKNWTNRASYTYS